MLLEGVSLIQATCTFIVGNRALNLPDQAAGMGWQSINGNLLCCSICDVASLPSSSGAFFGIDCVATRRQGGHGLCLSYSAHPSPMPL